MTRRRARLALLTALAIAPAAATARPVARADDWAIERTPGRRPAGRGPRVRPMRGELPRAAEAQRVATAPHEDPNAEAERWLALALARPVDGPMITRLVRIHRERDGSTDRLVARLEELAGTVDDPARAFASACVLGHVEARARSFAAAIAAYGSAAALRPSDPIPLVGLGRIHRERGELAEATTDLEAAFERMTGAESDAEARRVLALELGRLALARRDFDATERWFERATRGRSRYERAELARAYAEAGEHERAVRVLEGLADSARGDAREHAPALRDLGLAQVEAGRFDEAIASLGRARSAAAGDTGLVLEIDDVAVAAHRRAGRLAAYVDALAARPPRDGAGLARLASLEEELGRDEAALGDYARAIARAPRTLEFRAARIRLLIRGGQVDAALAEEAALVAQAPHESRFVVPAIERLVSLGRRELALQAFDAASRRAGDERAVHAALAELAERLGELDRLAAELVILVRVEPDEPSHRIALASDRLARGDGEAARVLLERAIADARTPRALVAVARALADRGFVREAEQALEAAGARAPDDLEVVRARADLLDPDRRAAGERPDRQRDALALATWQRVLAHPGADDATRREARRRIVALEARAGTLGARASEWGRVLAAGAAAEGSTSAIDAGYLLIEARERERPLDAAGMESVARRLVALAPREPAAWLAIERACTVRGDHACAIEALERLVEVDATHADAYFDRLIGQAEASYRDDVAMRFARAAVERSPTDPRTEVRLGRLLRRRGDAEGAIAAFRRALAHDERRHETWLELAELLVIEHDEDGAARAFERVLVLAPDDDVVTRTAELAARALGGAGRDEAVLAMLLPQVAARPGLEGLHRVLFATLERRLAALEGRDDEASRAERAAIGARGIAVLLEALANPEADRALRAARLLGRLRLDAAFDALLAAAARHPAASVRHEALVAAASLATRDRRESFRALIDAPERRTRVRAASVFAALGTDEAERVALREHEDPWVRAVFVLASIAAAVPVDAAWLEAHFARERDPSLRASILLAMAAHGPRFVEPLTRLVLRPGVVGDAARIALARIDATSADAALASVLVDADADDAELRRSAWLAHLGRALPFPGLASFGVLDLDAGLRALTRGLMLPAAPPSARVLDAIAERLAFGPEPARAVVLLAELEALVPTLPESPALGAALALAMHDVHPATRADAMRLLARCDPARADRLLPDALADSDASVVVAALAGASAQAVRAEGGRLAVLVGAHPAPPVRRLAAERASSADATDVLRALESAAIVDPVAFVRESAVRSLRQLDPTNVTLAEVARSDPEPRVRAAAADRVQGMSDADSRHDVDVGVETRVPMRSRAGPAGDRTFDG